MLKRLPAGHSYSAVDQARAGRCSREIAYGGKDQPAQAPRAPSQAVFGRVIGQIFSGLERNIGIAAIVSSREQYSLTGSLLQAAAPYPNRERLVRNATSEGQRAPHSTFFETSGGAALSR